MKRFKAIYDEDSITQRFYFIIPLLIRYQSINLGNDRDHQYRTGFIIRDEADLPVIYTVVRRIWSSMLGRRLQ